MQLKKIQDELKQYHVYLKSLSEHPDAYIWESLWYFQNNWDEEAEDFRAMYDQSLENTKTRRLWKDHNYYPKELMLKLMSGQSDYAWAMFRDLFDESKSIDGRLGRFKAGCDELLRIYRTNNPHSVENNHYHDGNRMISLYLSFRYPLQYTLFHYPAFKIAMEVLGATKSPESFEIERFFKTSRTIYTFALKEEGLIGSMQALLPEERHFSEESLLLVHDFYNYLRMKNSD